MQNLVLKKQWFISNKPGQILDYYELEQKSIGSGTFGTVLKGRLKDQKSDNAWRAVKKIPKKRVTDKVEFLNQIEILRKLDHPNIIKLYETFQDDRNIYMVTQLCTGGELFDKIIEKGYFTEEEAKVVFKQIMLALNYCHAQGVAHRDLKPQNFLFLNKDKDSPIKLIDFGLSVKFNKEKVVDSMKTFVGTSYYMAPEVMKGIYDHKCDIWSAGVILYILVTGIPPFNGENDEEILKAVRKMIYTFNIPEMSKVSIALKELISGILVEASKRPTAEEVLNNEWMQKGASTEHLPVNLARMKSFSDYTKLKKIVVMMIATQLHERDITELGKVFKSIDKNHDGQLTLEEIRTALLNHKDKPAMVEVDKILNDIDIDGSGKINYTEFITSCMSHALIQKQDNIHMAFKMMDKDQNGTITKEELKKVLSQPQYDFNQAVLDDVIKECDKNGDGVIDYNEFLDAVSKTG